MTTRTTNPQAKIYDRIRHPAAARAAASEPATAQGLDHLKGHKTALLVTYKRSGDPVPTPIWFGLADGKAYIRTAIEDWKVKRARNDSRARMAPCTARGKPKGAWVDGTVRVLPPEEHAHAEEAIQANYGLGRKLYQRGVGEKMELTYLEVTPR